MADSAASAASEYKRGRSVGVVIVAAGSSNRMNGVDKTMALLCGMPLLAHTVEAFQQSPCVHDIALVVSATNIEPVERLARDYAWSKLREIVIGGARRQDSVLAGVRVLAGTDIVLVHDGARPLVDGATIERAVAAAEEYRAAVAAVPVKDTIKVATPDLTVQSTVPRERLWAVQTPQAFDRTLLLEAHRLTPDDVTDDAMMVERLGHPVKIFPGSYENIKVTTPEDLIIVEALLKARAAGDEARALA